MLKQSLFFALTFLAAPAFAEGETYVIPEVEADSVSKAEGLEAWLRIHEVVSHPRCANCHVGEDNIPMWSGPSYGKTRPHGMAINAGESRIGAETLLCSTCHITSTDLGTAPHAPPRHGLDWALAPVEFEWFGKNSDEICAQLRDPERNGGRDWRALADHIAHDAEASGPVLWGFAPGGGREPAPYSVQAHIDDLITWGAAGQPCADD